MKGLLKGLAGIFAFGLCALCIGINAFAATGIYVGKDASAEGTTLIGLSVEEEIGIAGVPVIIEKGLIRKGDVIESANGYKYTLPEDSAKMIVGRTMAYAGDNGWNNYASNEYGVSVISNITTEVNVDAAAADPFVQDGLSEEKIATIVASTSKTAKEAVQTLCSILDEAGAATAETVLIADQDGAWIVENYTGHQYAAVKLPDDCMGTFSHEPVIKTADPDDADTICSADLFTLPEKNGFAIYDDDKNLDLILTYNYDNTYSDESHLRGWIGHDIFAPSEELDYDPEGGYDVFFKPDEKVGLAQVFSFFRNRYEGTAYDLADDDNSVYYGINNQFVSSVNVIQVFDDVEAPMSTVIWSTPSNPTASPFIAIPAIADELPDAIATDVEEEKFDDDILQFGFAKLNTSVLGRRQLYGGSIRQYWEGMEALSVSDVAASVRGEWKEAYSESPEKAAADVDGYVDEVVGKAEDECERLTEELDWYLFRNGVIKSSIPDDELIPFECSFDAVSYATANGWDTKVEDDLFTATKDGKTIEVVIGGENEGNVTFKGFDNDKLMQDFLTDEETAEEAVSEEAATEEAAEEAAAEEAAPAEEPAKEEAAEDATAEEAQEVKEEAPEAEEAKADPAEEEEKIEKLASEAAQKIEVDTIAELEGYFVEKINSVPRDGWAEGEIATQLGGVATDITGIVMKYFDVEDIEALLDMNTTPVTESALEMATDEDLAKVGDRLAATGLDLSALVEKYFTSLYQDVSTDIVNGRLSQDGAVKILDEARVDIEGIATLYLEGFAGTFGEVFNTDLTPEEVTEILAELGDGTLQLMDDYGAIDKSALGLGDMTLKDLTQADIDVVITLSEMDDDVINGLSEMLGVDVRATLDAYIEEINKLNPRVQVVEENHETQEAYSAPDTEVMAAIEKAEESASEDDIVIPQEVIDILNEAIAEAAAEREAAGMSGEIVEEAEAEPAAEEAVETAAAETAPDDAVETEASEPAEAEGEGVTLNIGKVAKKGDKVLLPAYLLKYFN